MSKPLKPLSGPTRQALGTLARLYVANDLSRNVEGMGGFARHYMDTGMTAKDRQILDAFQEQVRAAQRDLADEVAADIAAAQGDD